MKKTLLLGLSLVWSLSAFGAVPVINLISGTNITILTTNRIGGGVDVQINSGTLALNPGDSVDTNLTAPLIIGIEGDSLASEAQPAATITNWSSQLTNKYRQYGNLINAAVSGTGVAISVSNYNTGLYTWRPRDGTNGIIWYHGLNNDTTGSNYLTTILTFSNHLVTLRADGWKIGVIDLHPRGYSAIGDATEQNRIMINDWIAHSRLIDYHVSASKLFHSTNSQFYHDPIHLNHQGQERIMKAIADSMLRGPNQVVEGESPVVIQPDRYFGVYVQTNIALLVDGAGRVGVGTTNLASDFTVAGDIRVDAPDANIILHGNLASMTLWETNFTQGHQWTLNNDVHMLQRSYQGSAWRTNMIIDSTNGLVTVTSNMAARSYVVYTNFAISGPVGITNGLSAIWNSNGMVTFLRTSVKGYITIPYFNIIVNW